MAATDSEKPNTPVHDWLRPRLQALVEEAEKAGLPRQTVVAVIIDIIAAPPFDEAVVSAASFGDEPVKVSPAAPKPIGIELDEDRTRVLVEHSPQGNFPDFGELRPPSDLG